jgi:hypothetical protein
MYNRHENSMHSRETVTDAITSLVDQNDSVQDHISLLSKVLLLLRHHLPKYCLHYTAIVALMSLSGKDVDAWDLRY